MYLLPWLLVITCSRKIAQTLPSVVCLVSAALHAQLSLIPCSIASQAECRQRGGWEGHSPVCAIPPVLPRESAVVMHARTWSLTLSSSSLCRLLLQYWPVQCWLRSPVNWLNTWGRRTSPQWLSEARTMKTTACGVNRNCAEGYSRSL